MLARMRFIAILLVIMLSNCKVKVTEQSAAEYFKKQLGDKGISIERIDTDGNYVVKHQGAEYIISLENASSNAIRDNSMSHIDTLVSSIPVTQKEFKNFAEIRMQIFPSYESKEFFTGNAVNDAFSEKALVRFVIFQDGKLIYIGKNDLKQWNLDVPKLKSLAFANLETEFNKSEIEVSEIEGRKLYHINADFPLKSTFLGTKKFYSKLSPKLGRDIYAVMPVRDFCYFFSGADKDFFLSRIGQTVQKEYAESGYKISKELFQINSSGVKPVGTF